MAVPTRDSARPLSYRSLTHVPGLPRLLLAALLGRTAIQMLSVAIVLFVLARFHSATLAGLTVFAYAFPGVLVSPVAGALLDRSGRVPLIRLDYSIAAVAVGLIVLFNAVGVLSPGLLIAVTVLGSLTAPLSSAGTRSLFPVLVPRALWDRANAMDSAGFVIAAVVGAPLAGVIAGLIGRRAAVLATALVFAAAAVSLLGMRRLSAPASTPAARSVHREAWAGIVYLMRHPTLRGLAASLSVAGLGSGLLIVALPVLVLGRLHANAAVVGALWAVSAGSGGVSALLAGRLGSEDRERGMLTAGLVVSAAALLLLAVAPDIAVALLAMLLWGSAGGWMDIGLFSIRQRRTHPAWFGRAFAVSMSLNYSGVPVGSALAGPLLAPGMVVCLGVAAAVTMVAAVILPLTIPGRATAEEVASPVAGVAGVAGGWDDRG
jgi:MFS family permease